MAQKISFYFDEHMPRVVEQGLTQRGYKVIMAVDVGMIGKDDDADHLPFARENQAVIVTRDKPFAGRTVKRIDHSEFAEQHTPEEVVGRVFWLK